LFELIGDSEPPAEPRTLALALGRDVFGYRRTRRTETVRHRNRLRVTTYAEA